MSTMDGNNSNGSMEDLPASGAARPSRISASRPARASNVVDDAVTMAGDELAGLTAAGLPERKYSFHALIAMGFAGFVIGRICAR